MLVHIDGYYDKGGTKQNKAEAEAVVNEIIRRLSDEQLRTKSIGVVTFNIIQQNLIEDMLADEFSKNPNLKNTTANPQNLYLLKILRMYRAMSEM